MLPKLPRGFSSLKDLLDQGNFYVVCAFCSIWPKLSKHVSKFHCLYYVIVKDHKVVFIPLERQSRIIMSLKPETMCWRAFNARGWFELNLVSVCQGKPWNEKIFLVSGLHKRNIKLNGKEEKLNPISGRF